MKCECQNCDWTGPQEATDPVHDIWSRIAPGEPMPAGDCPECGAFVQPVDNDAAQTPTIGELQE